MLKKSDSYNVSLSGIFINQLEAFSRNYISKIDHRIIIHITQCGQTDNVCIYTIYVNSLRCNLINTRTNNLLFRNININLCNGKYLEKKKFKEIM